VGSQGEGGSGGGTSMVPVTGDGNRECGDGVRPGEEGEETR
jgi:hypothetical protein